MRKLRCYNGNSKIGLTNVIIFFVVLNCFVMLFFCGNAFSKNVNDLSKIVITDYLTSIVNSNIKASYLEEYSINNLIIINYKNNKITNIDYDMNNAYNLMILIKKEIQTQILNLKNGNLPYKSYFLKKNLIIDVPIYYYTNNNFINEIGPKIPVKINLIQSMDSSVKTVVKSYGINTSLIELYFIFNIKSNVNGYKKYQFDNSFSILISSKVIQGEIPSFYNGIYESSSKIIK